jgi:hypothetical protein
MLVPYHGLEEKRLEWSLSRQRDSSRDRLAHMLNRSHPSIFHRRLSQPLRLLPQKHGMVRLGDEEEEQGQLRAAPNH